MHRFILGFSLALVLGPVVVQQSTDEPTRIAVAAAAKYVENYTKELSLIVCEETQVQTLIHPNGKVAKTRTLVSDLAFLKIGDSWAQHSFRDIISVDGKPVRNRDDRLKKLFLEGSKTAVEQARAIATESGRYNLGINRMGVSPLLPLGVLDSHRIAKFDFSLSGRTLSFEEPRTPTYLAVVTNGKRRDLPSRGSFELVLETGAIETATLTAENAERISTTFVVRYVDDPKIKLRVPSSMSERYTILDKPKDDHLESKMTYSSFRRFQVNVDEKIK